MEENVNEFTETVIELVTGYGLQVLAAAEAGVEAEVFTLTYEEKAWTGLVYPMEKEAMRFLNTLGNKFFAKAFSWLLNQDDWPEQ